MLEKAKGFGKIAGGIAIGAAVLSIPVVLLFGASWASEKISPWLKPMFGWTLLACLLVLVPTAFFRASRGFSAIGFLCASYIFGFVLWICSFLLVLDLWGMFAVVVGLLMAGIGIVSVAILAALFHADWESLGGLAIMIGATFGVRFLSVWLASKADREREVYLA